MGKKTGPLTHVVHSINDAGHRCVTPHRGLEHAEREHAHRVMHTDHVEVKIWSIKPLEIVLPFSRLHIQAYEWQPG